MLKENIELLEQIEKHVIALQSGKYGQPTRTDLEFAGNLHVLIENTKRD